MVLVDEIRDRRVVRGRLGCPECEARYPLADGVLRLDQDAASDREAPGRSPASGPEPTAALLSGTGTEEGAVRLGALLGLPEAEGPFLLGPGLARVAAPLARMAEDAEVLCLADDPGGEARARPRDGGEGARASRDGCSGAERVTRIVGASTSELPVFSGRLGGAAVVDGGAAVLEEVVRTLERGGRAVVLDPDPGLSEAAEALPVEVVARDERALVAVRRE